ncbi:4'-phosphopantetheinyl transferase superfamily protein [Clostridium estertheticum]|uniref:4'-phosphopantetheinyl transferase superfamily protein n=1 Tax=Clostridium estertheticum TaxID=238834 RepID=UPI001CF38C10|nr:4'-phosphopantetheinyl transferase superfamily protein [Clostridium estertheticum]MCB2360157.1 4'-phosphopantetheinyl transferase superfamily protein [Clostridium estertheticum]
MKRISKISSNETPKKICLRNKGYRIWTLKDSYIKADGRGLSILLNSFSIIEDEF